MNITAYQSTPNFGVRFNKENIKSIVDKDANEILKEYKINDSHWNDIAYKLNCIRNGNTRIVKEDTIYNQALDNYMNELRIF